MNTHTLHEHVVSVFLRDSAFHLQEAPQRGCSRRGPPRGPARAGAAGVHVRVGARRVERARRSAREGVDGGGSGARRPARFVADVACSPRPRRQPSLAPSRAAGRTRSFRASRRDVRPPLHRMRSKQNQNHPRDPPRPRLLEVLGVRSASSVTPWFLPSPSPTFQPAFRSIGTPRWRRSWWQTRREVDPPTRAGVPKGSRRLLEVGTTTRTRLPARCPSREPPREARRRGGSPRRT